MDKFTDSKGIEHYSEAARDSANRSYAYEERRQTRLLEEQARLQAEQLELAKETAKAQKAHQKRVELLAEKEAAENQAQRAFIQDVEWLEHSSAPERYKYLAAKAEDKLITELAAFALEKTGLTKATWPNEETDFKKVIAVCCATEAAWKRKSGELVRLRSATIPNPQHRDAGCNSFISLVLSIPMVLISALCIYGLIIKDKGHWYDEWQYWAASLIPIIISYFLLRTTVRSFEHVKAARADKALTEKTITSTEDELRNLETDLQQQNETTWSAYRAWESKCRDRLAATWKELGATHLLQAELRNAVTEFEKQYPPALRIDWDAVELESLTQSITRLENKILNLIQQKHIGPSLLAAQYKAAGDWNLGAEVSRSSLLAEFANNQHTDPQQALAHLRRDGHSQAFESLSINKAELNSLGDKLAEASPAELEAMGFKKKDCFIATACYEGEDHPAVEELRRFRDKCLIPSKTGAICVSYYYRWSPRWADVIRKNHFLKKTVRHGLVTPALLVARFITSYRSTDK